MTGSEVAGRARFDAIRYAQCWEDADILVEALQPRPGHRCLSIASAGDNVLALASRGADVVAVDLSAAQLACLELRVAAYAALDHAEMLRLIGSRPADGPARHASYRACRPRLSEQARRFWDGHAAAISKGIGAAGKFERYFATFRRLVLPWVHSRRTIARLLRGGDRAAQEHFYAKHWNTWRWRAMFRLFFSRTVMGWLGRDPAFFQYVEGSVADRILERTRHALTQIDCATNPYLHWILTGTHGDALPFALREENFAAIRENLPRVSWRHASLEAVLEDKRERFDGFNLSDIFEYISAENSERLLRAIAAAARPGARLAYWNMLVPRSRPASMADLFEERDALGRALLARDKAFFYSRFVVEERTETEPG